MHDSNAMIRLDDTGTVRVGQAGVPLDDVIGFYRPGHTPQLVQGRFPMLSADDIAAAVAFHEADADDEAPGPRQRDVEWRRGHQAVTQPMGEDVHMPQFMA